MYRISEFARLSRVSAKMLRHYDERGLLKPAYVDPSTDYRFYTAEQLPRLNCIIALKDLGFTLQQVAALLDDDLNVEQLKGMLKLRRAEVAQRLEAEQLRLAEIEARLGQIEREGQLPRYDVVLRPIAVAPVAAARAVAYNDVVVSQLLNEVEWYVGRHRIRAGHPPLVIYHACEPSMMEVEVAVPVSGAIPGNGTVRPTELPGVHLMACLVHVGSDATLPSAYNALHEWVAAHGYRVAGPTRELYLRYAPEAPPHLPPTFVATRPDLAVTEYQVPVISA
jgi:DNA-binding transcriptional MerR regulator